MHPRGQAGRPKPNLLTLGVAALAIAIAIVSLIVAAAAFIRAGDDGDTVTAQPSAPAPTWAAPPSPTQSAAASVAPVPSDDTSRDPGQLQPDAEYPPAYENQTLTVQSGSNYVDIDLDEPRVRPANGSDGNYYADGGGTGKFDFGASERVAPVQSAEASPPDCVEAIRSSASVNDMAAPVGLTVCVLTSRANAASEGKTQKIVRLHVDSVAKDNDTLTLSLTAWNVPY